MNHWCAIHHCKWCGIYLLLWHTHLHSRRGLLVAQLLVMTEKSTWYFRRRAPRHKNTELSLSFSDVGNWNGCSSTYSFFTCENKVRRLKALFRNNVFHTDACCIYITSLDQKKLTIQTVHDTLLLFTELWSYWCGGYEWLDVWDESRSETHTHPYIFFTYAWYSCYMPSGMRWKKNNREFSEDYILYSIRKDQ